MDFKIYGLTVRCVTSFAGVCCLLGVVGWERIEAAAPLVVVSCLLWVVIIK